MRAVIIGGGVAGMSTALALHKAGIECEVFEARDGHSDGVGAFLTLAVNGISTLRMLGLDVARVPGIDTPRMQLMLSDAKPLTEFPLGPVLGGSAEATVTTVTRTVKRGELYGALRERAEAMGIRISYGKRLVTAETSADGASVTAYFDDGSTAVGDLLIGADGLHSRTRGIIDAKAVAPRYLGLLNAGGYVTAGARVGADGAVASEGEERAGRAGGAAGSEGEGHAGGAAASEDERPAGGAAASEGEGLAGGASGDRAGGAPSTGATLDERRAGGRWGEPGVMHMMFGTQMFFSWLDDEEGGAWWFANPAMKREPARGELSAISAERWRERLLTLVAEDSGPAGAIIRSSDELFTPWPTHDFKKVKVWSRGRMIIVGDAAHAASPSSGQGASMAIEDAAVLALALRDSASIEEAFALYERVRRPRVSRIVAQGKRNGSGKTPGRLGRAMRDAFLRRMFARPPREQDQSWLYEYPLDWERGL